MLNFNKNFLDKKVLAFILFATAPIILYLLINLHYFQKKSLYNISFDENISGLEIGSSILFNGVNIGHIKNISINYENDQIDIKALIHNKMNVENKVAQIESQGFSGHKYVNLVQSKEYKLIHKNNTLCIPSRKSGMVKIMNNAPLIADQSSSLIKKLNAIDLKLLNNILKNINNISNKFDKLIDNANKALDKTNNILGNMNYAIKDSKSNLQDFFLVSLPKLNNSINSLDELLIDSNKIMKKFKEKPVKFLLDWYN
ncbi:MlaD family protein [Candidatus Cytomitobacter primus]|nr:MCE family protein [Candidatus Cytomitobacter primus]